MGCISSKVISRSLSFQEELNQSLHGRRPNGISRKSSSAHFLSLISETNKSSSASVELGEEKQEQPASSVPPKVAESMEVDLSRRSKSFHWFEKDYEVSSLSQESFDGVKQTNGGRTRARSFHTVEEFDAMVEKICLSRTGQTGFVGKEEDGSLQLHHPKSSSELSTHAVIEDMGTLLSSRPKPEKVVSNHDKSRTTEETAQKENSSLKGLKRKAIANELESLSIPPGIGFQGVEDLREWAHAGGQVYSPGTYVTPKFGSYNLSKSGLADKCSEGNVFDPELVAAFEECLEQLKVEEERILKQIEENLKEENQNTHEKLDEVEIASHRNNRVCI